MKTSAWDIWERDFKKGDEVILIDDNTMFDWGTLDYNDQEVILSSGLRPARRYPHHKIVFICHDGFPARKFLAPFPKEKFETELVPEVMRAALAAENSDRLKQEMKFFVRAAQTLGVAEKSFYEHETIKSALSILETLAYPIISLHERIKERINRRDSGMPGYRCGYGHPVEFNPVEMQLFNRGNFTSWFWSNHSQEEVLRMTCANGLIGQLWDVSGIYHFELN